MPEMNFCKNSLIILLSSVSLSSAYAAPLTVEDYCYSTPATVRSMTPLQDGESYSAISEDGKSIDIYSYKTGKKTGTLFSIDGQKGSLRFRSSTVMS